MSTFRKQRVKQFLFSYQGATAAHGEWTLDQGDGLCDSSHYSGHHLSLLSHCDRTRLVHSDDGSGGGGRGRSRCAHLGCCCLQHPGGRVTDLKSQTGLSRTNRLHVV